MIKRLGIALGLILFTSLGRAESCDGINTGYKEFKLVCAENVEDFNRGVNGAKMADGGWRLLGSVQIIRTGNTTVLYCQTLYKW